MPIGEISNAYEWKEKMEEFKNPRCYVRMRDSFLSGWGEAEGKKNILFVPVRNSRDADNLKYWILSHRREMKNVDWGYFGNKPPQTIYKKDCLVQFLDMPLWKKEAGIEEEV